MVGSSVPEDRVRVEVCHTDAALAAASDLVNHYRHHYGERPDQDDRTFGWLTDMVRSGMLTVFTASDAASANTSPIGLATCHAVPASLALGRFWQVRDLYVLPTHRRLGAGAALVGAARDAARAAGAVRLSLVTEPDNQVALALYKRLGFRPVDGIATLSLDLGPAT
ncbi:Ribosomal protein S18 acetylase RimI [Nocardioides alpinus]|uniref:GNAT family N-acetyltransferase n=1 Tax=Nocardioides alpinus TaxID=748909 RepID=A0A1I0ZSI1_9ACTN|nr:GNAT family N-acetyltransferase [Nocardioides alpinus]PKH41915.1 GNAT family N-acetyltransferase [Nocardioides alpinus]SFB27123.1 Ribosomal protein S18 acetylase RimI [Nocardioides alpinus]